MGIKLKREKKRHILLSIIYRLHKVLPMSKGKKLKLYLDLEWIFDRLSHETSFQHYEEDLHPLRIFTKNIILKHINSSHSVLDLGCKYGNITHSISEKAKQVVGVDFDEKAIKIANDTYKRDNLSFVNEEALVFINKQDYEFDTLILSHILEHLDKSKDFIAKFSKYFNFIYIELPDFDKTYLNHYRKDLNSDLIYTDTDLEFKCYGAKRKRNEL
jgi:SAM-dependent methyltransferase